MLANAAFAVAFSGIPMAAVVLRSGYRLDTATLGLMTSATMVAVQAGAMGMRVWSGRWTDRRRNRPAYLRACAWTSALLFAAVRGLAPSMPAGWASVGEDALNAANVTPPAAAQPRLSTRAASSAK